MTSSQNSYLSSSIRRDDVIPPFIAKPTLKSRLDRIMNKRSERSETPSDEEVESFLDTINSRKKEYQSVVDDETGISVDLNASFEEKLQHILNQRQARKSPRLQVSPSKFSEYVENHRTQGNIEEGDALDFSESEGRRLRLMRPNVDDGYNRPNVDDGYSRPNVDDGYSGTNEMIHKLVERNPYSGGNDSRNTLVRSEYGLMDHSNIDHSNIDHSVGNRNPSMHSSLSSNVDNADVVNAISGTNDSEVNTSMENNPSSGSNTGLEQSFESSRLNRFSHPPQREFAQNEPEDQEQDNQPETDIVNEMNQGTSHHSPNDNHSPVPTTIVENLPAQNLPAPIETMEIGVQTKPECREFGVQFDTPIEKPVETNVKPSIPQSNQNQSYNTHESLNQSSGIDETSYQDTTMDNTINLTKDIGSPIATSYTPSTTKSTTKSAQKSTLRNRRDLNFDLGPNRSLPKPGQEDLPQFFNEIPKDEDEEEEVSYYSTHGTKWRVSKSRFQKFKASNLLSRDALNLLGVRKSPPKRIKSFHEVAPYDPMRMNPKPITSPYKESQSRYSFGLSPEYSQADDELSENVDVIARNSVFSVPARSTSPTQSEVSQADLKGFKKSFVEFYKDYIIEDSEGTHSNLKFCFDGEFNSMFKCPHFIPFTKDFPNVQQQLIAGSLFYKNNSRAHPNVRFFFIDINYKTLCWCKSKSKQSKVVTAPTGSRALSLLDIEKVLIFEVPGKAVHAKFKSLKATVANFYIIDLQTSKKKLPSVELATSDLEKAKLWVAGLIMLIRQAREKRRKELQETIVD